MADHDYFADSEKIHYMPGIPTSRRGFRDPFFVRDIMLRMGDQFVDMLDELCAANQRTRREIVEILISEAMYDKQHNPKTSSIDPF